MGAIPVYRHILPLWYRGTRLLDVIDLHSCPLAKERKYNPTSSLDTLDHCFERPEEFLPERWYKYPQMVRDKRGFAPFSQGTHIASFLLSQAHLCVSLLHPPALMPQRTGHYGCVGKNLALLELRFVFALLVQRYDIGFAPGEDGVRVWKEMKDQFTAALGRLELVFNVRGK